jgi:hypothetical protein
MTVRSLCTILPILLLSVPVFGLDWFVDLETGFAFPGYNDVQVPNDSTGTRFSLTEVLDVETEFVFRARIGLITGRHWFSLLAAPLRLEGSGVLRSELHFADEVFGEGDRVDGLYRFDSYRLSWRYRLLDGSRFSLAAGLTAKIRDAEIRLESGGFSAATTNTGFVPLIGFDARWNPSPCFTMLLEGDALVGPQGRAEDVFLGVMIHPGSSTDLRAGYRIVEGGADVESVYNFTLVSYLMAGITRRF